MFKKSLLFVLPITLILSCAKTNSTKPSPTETQRTLTALRQKLHKPQIICLNMIVKNEAEVICRCLDSVKDVIDTWVIVDTGSTDGTQEIIKKHLKNIPGVLYERPWKNWGETRSEAYELAKGRGDYILFMDADDVLKFNGEAKLPTLTEDVYFMWRGDDAFSYIKQQLVKGNLDWRWVGVTHEYLDISQPYTSALLEDVRYISISDGASSHDPKKFWKNVDLLLDGLKKEPNNTRYTFYLAESYFDAKERAKALEWYQKRVAMGGYEVEEIFWSKFRIAYILQFLGLSDEIVIEAYKDAITYRPHRGEPYYYLVELLNNKKQYQAAYDYIQMHEVATKLPMKDYLFNSDWVQDYGMLFQKSITSYYLGKYQESVDACDQLLANERLPKEWVALTKNNRKYSVDKLNELSATTD